MTYTAISVIGMDISAVEDRIVSQWKPQCCQMEITIYQKVMRLFPPTWRHHHQTSVSTIALLLIQKSMDLILGVQYGVTNL